MKKMMKSHEAVVPMKYLRNKEDTICIGQKGPRKRYSVVVLDTETVTESRTPLFPVDMKMLKEMCERMEEALTDDIYERYMPEKTCDGRIAKKLWEKDVDTYVDLCKAFGFKASKKSILKKGREWMKKYDEMRQKADEEFERKQRGT